MDSLWGHLANISPSVRLIFLLIHNLVVLVISLCFLFVLVISFRLLFGELEEGEALLLFDFTIVEIIKMPNVMRQQRYRVDLEIFLSILLEIFSSIFLEIFTGS
jgi:hypothetical protein